jgi:UPF0716 protein FxsA
LFVIFVVIPVLELLLLVRLGGAIGLGPTLGLLLGTALIGSALARNQSRRVLEGWRTALSQGRVPEQGIVSGMLVLVGALLLITPGVLTDVLGLLLLVPWTRRPIEALLRAYLQRQLASGQLRIQGAQRGPKAPTEVGRAVYRPGEVIDTQGEEVDERRER